MKEKIEILDELFSNANPSWYYIKRIIENFISQYSEGNMVYNIPFSKEDSKYIFSDPFENIMLLEAILKKIGIKGKCTVSSDNIVKIVLI